MRKLIDAHHHLWDLTACNYPWLMARGVVRFFGDPAPIQRNYLVDELRSDAGSYDLDGSVHVQVGVAPGDEVKETAWLQSVGDNNGLPSAIVAYCNLDDHAAPEKIAEHKTYSRLRGIRQIVGRSKGEDAVTGSAQLLDSPVWQENLAMLGELELSFDLQLIPDQVERAAKAVAQASDTRVALCHCGSPWDQTDSGIARWRSGMQQLAALPNVYCKISGLGMFNHHWSIDSIRPIVESCIDIFGAQRCMFGSNFPVDKLHASYADIWRCFEEITAGLDPHDQDRLFSETAREFYRIS